MKPAMKAVRLVEPGKPLQLREVPVPAVGDEVAGIRTVIVPTGT